MAVTIRGEGRRPSFNPHCPDVGEPLCMGDLILMELPESEPAPPGWTEAGAPGGRFCWRYATGQETVLPFPAAWLSGVAPVNTEGTTA